MAGFNKRQVWGGLYGSQKPAAAPASNWTAWGAPMNQATRDAQAAPAPATPAAPQGPAPAPQPYDPAAEAAKNTATRNVTLGNNEATWQTQNLGYTSGFNADGTLNTANPYSEAQRLQDSYHQHQLGTTNGMAARGQLYAGAYGNAQAADDRNYAQGYAGLQGRTAQGYHGIQAGQLGTYATNAQGVSDAGFNSLVNTTYGK